MCRWIPTARTIVASIVSLFVLLPASAQSQSTNQQIDEEYTRLIAEHLRDSRITTELVDYLPASNTVPTPLDFHGRIVGTPGELTYGADIHRYLQAIADASPRATMWSIGKSEEGRDMMLIAIADEETITRLDEYKGMLAELTDPRRTSETRARELIQTAKPIYWITSGMHSPENGGPEMLMELSYRLVVDESPFIQEIRNNIITFITPVIEMDGREKQVDTYYFNKSRGEDAQRLPLMYWGKYVAHDNNRDGMGQFLELTRNVTRTFIEWTPTVMHDLHEAQSYLYSSTGTGPYNEQIDPITINEWWMLAQMDVMEMTKRGVPGVWTYGFYDGWTPNYMFFIAHTHNSIGRFYEVQSYGPDNRDSLRLPDRVTSREWFRPNPPLPMINWGPRNNTNIQQSGVLFSLNHVAAQREMYLENYWLKNKRAVERGRAGDPYAWVIPANQRRKADAADAVNELRRQGLEIHTAGGDFEAGDVEVRQGGYIVRADQPYRTLADMYFSLQNFAPANPRPYDDTGWTFQLMRNITITPVADSSILTRRMTMLESDARAPGGIEGNGNVLVVDHTTDNNLMAFRFRHPEVRMLAAEEDFELEGHQFRAGAFVIPDVNRTELEPTLRELGLSGWAVSNPPAVPTHELDIPRIGYVHAWQRTQDEGWVRAALDTYGVPYDYFADQRLRDGNLRSRYDVIIFPHVGGDATSQVNGIEIRDSTSLPYQRTDSTPNLGRLDESPDIRGGMGLEGLLELAKFVEEGGTLIVEGATSTIFPEYGLTPGVSVEEPDQLFLPGSIIRGIISDPTSPIAYGYIGNQLPVYSNGEPILNAGGGVPGRFARFFGGGGIPGVGQNTTPMANRLRLSPWEQDSAQSGQRGHRGGEQDETAQFRQMARAFGLDLDEGNGPRVIMSFPGNPADMLLSGSLVGGEHIANRAQVVDAPLGDGHVVMFSIRPFWRWQTQGTFFLGFNTILNWNDLGVGRAETEEVTDGAGSGSAN